MSLEAVTATVMQGMYNVFHVGQAVHQLALEGVLDVSYQVGGDLIYEDNYASRKTFLRIKNGLVFNASGKPYTEEEIEAATVLYSIPQKYLKSAEESDSSARPTVLQRIRNLMRGA